MKTLCERQIQRITSYLNYKNFNNNIFKEHIKLNLEKFNITEISIMYFQGFCLSVLDSFTSLKKNMLEPININS